MFYGFKYMFIVSYGYVMVSCGFSIVVFDVCPAMCSIDAYMLLLSCNVFFCLRQINDA